MNLKIIFNDVFVIYVANQVPSGGTPIELISYSVYFSWVETSVKHVNMSKWIECIRLGNISTCKETLVTDTTALNLL